MWGEIVVLMYWKVFVKFQSREVDIQKRSQSVFEPLSTLPRNRSEWLHHLAVSTLLANKKCMVQVFSFVPSRLSLHSSQSSTSNPKPSRKTADDVGSGHIYTPSHCRLWYFIRIIMNIIIYFFLPASATFRLCIARMFQGLPYWCHVVYSSACSLSLVFSFARRIPDTTKDTGRRTLAEARTILTMVRTTWHTKGRLV